ncbi:hypothetical protein Tco_0010794 [Tanacetum coccineum]
MNRTEPTIIPKQQIEQEPAGHKLQPLAGEEIYAGKFYQRCNRCTLTSSWTVFDTQGQVTLPIVNKARNQQNAWSSCRLMWWLKIRSRIPNVVPDFRVYPDDCWFTSEGARGRGSRLLRLVMIILRGSMSHDVELDTGGVMLLADRYGVHLWYERLDVARTSDHRSRLRSSHRGVAKP